MWRFIAAALLAGLLSLPPAARAVSITGIMIYSTDGAGKPTGFDFDRPEVDRGQLWRTGAHFHWYGLGVLSGLPPESLEGGLLNAPDFSVQIPLDEGANEFTLLGDPGPLSEIDAYQKFALNLFFDGAQDNPGISVLFPRGGYRYGSPPVANESDIVLGLPVTPVSATPNTVYDDGVVKVYVGAVSFVAPHRFLDVNLVSAHAPFPGVDGESDWVGVLQVVVEGSVAAGPATGPGPRAFGIVPDAGSAGAGVSVRPGAGPGAPPLAGQAGAEDGVTDMPGGGAGPGWQAALATRTPAPDEEPGADAEQTPTPEGTTTRVGPTLTPTTGPRGTPSRTQAVRATQTPDPTANSATPTAKSPAGDAAAEERGAASATAGGAVRTPAAEAGQGDGPPLE